MIDCGCKGKTRHYVPLGDEVIKICIDCAKEIYKATIEETAILNMKGAAENDVLREVNSNRQALCQQEKS